jgi:tRNA G10  N-methylase Trm11
MDNYERKRKYILSKREDELIGELSNIPKDGKKIEKAAESLRNAKIRYIESKIEFAEFETTKTWIHDKKKIRHFENQIAKLKKQLKIIQNTETAEIISQYN